MTEYVIINKTAIQERIEELEIGLKTLSLTDGFKDIGRIDTLKEILSQSTPLIPEIEKSFNAGRRHELFPFSHPNKEGYISQLKLDI